MTPKYLVLNYYPLAFCAKSRNGKKILGYYISNAGQDILSELRKSPGAAWKDAAEQVKQAHGL